MSTPKKPFPGDPGDPAGLHQLAQRYLLWMQTHHYAPGTVEMRRLDLAHFIHWCLDRSVTQPSLVTLVMIERYQRHLYFSKKRNGQPLSLSYQGHQLIALRRWFTWMVRQKSITHNPTADMELPREEKRLPRHALCEHEVEAVLAQPDVATRLGLRDRAILETLYSTGLRRSELMKLQLADIDRTRSLVLVRCGKGKKDRFVPIGTRALAWIDKYLAESRPKLWQDESNPTLFVTGTSPQLSPNHLSYRVKQYMTSAGITHPGACHLFRHSTATLMLENGAGIRYLQALLGHESLRTTQIYTHVSISKLREVHRQTHPARLSRFGNPPREAPEQANDEPSDEGLDSDDDTCLPVA